MNCTAVEIFNKYEVSPSAYQSCIFLNFFSVFFGSVEWNVRWFCGCGAINAVVWWDILIAVLRKEIDSFAQTVCVRYGSFSQRFLQIFFLIFFFLSKNWCFCQVLSTSICYIYICSETIRLTRPIHSTMPYWLATPSELLYETWEIIIPNNSNSRTKRLYK